MTGEAERCGTELRRIYSGEIDAARTSRRRRLLRWLLDGLEEDLEVIYDGLADDPRVVLWRCR